MVLDALADVLPELWGGPYGRTLHFGIREHAMGAILNGIALRSVTRPYGGTFLCFSGYMCPAVRLAALRAIPGLDVVRPADANETVTCWRAILEHGDRPAGLILSRQPLPVLDREIVGPAAGAARCGYVLADSDGAPACSSSRPAPRCRSRWPPATCSPPPGSRRGWCRCRAGNGSPRSPANYRDRVLPPQIRARVGVEAGSGQGWRDIVGDARRIVSLEHFGAFADYQRLYHQFGITAEAVAAAARGSIRDSGAPIRPGGHQQTATPTTGGTGDRPA
jgi:transketolase